MAELFIGQIPEAIYFSLFLIYAKDLREKRLLFILLMIAQTILLRVLIPFDIWQQIDGLIFTYYILKLLYKQKAQITDVFTFIIASLIMFVINAIIYIIISLTIKQFIVYAILSRIILFIFLFCIRKKLTNITKLYKKLWNRNDKVQKKIKTTTFRSINVIIFNLTFYLVHIVLLFEMTKI